MAESKDINQDISGEITEHSEPKFVSLKESIIGNATQ